MAFEILRLMTKGKKKKFASLPEAVFFGKNLLSFCNGFLKNICVENIKNWVF